MIPRTQWNMNDDALNIILDDLRARQNARVLEIGTHNAYSALQLAAVCAHVTTIERDQRFHDQAAANIAHCANITLLHGDATIILKTLTTTFDVIIIDAQKSEYATYLTLSLPLLAANGTIYADNTLSHKRQLTDFYAALDTLPITAEELHTEQGLMRIEKK